MDHQVIGREFKRGLQQGLDEGRQEGERKILRRMLEKRFGIIPEWAEQRLDGLSEPEIEELGLRLLDAQGLRDLLP
jgi:hypothetical protein